ncbi:MAG: UpxY family transcription antiterminator [Candidatus Omnitrophica bacterium]|nr:UpxY family transcription antiterminator [Candidatus Omnitrophota bacterium]
MNALESFNWYVLYTKPRHEKFVESNLIEKGVEAFTPKVTLRKKWSDRSKLVQEPLFRGYCFAKFPLTDKLNVIMQQGVLQIVHFNYQYVPVPEEVVASLKIISEKGVQLDPCPYLKIGDKVVIRRGPLKGVEGFILERRNKNTSLVISIDVIASSVQCFVDADCVDAA